MYIKLATASLIALDATLTVSETLPSSEDFCVCAEDDASFGSCGDGAVADSVDSETLSLQEPAQSQAQEQLLYSTLRIKLSLIILLSSSGVKSLGTSGMNFLSDSVALRAFQQSFQ